MRTPEHPMREHPYYYSTDTDDIEPSQPVEDIDDEHVKVQDYWDHKRNFGTDCSTNKQNAG